MKQFYAFIFVLKWIYLYIISKYLSIEKWNALKKDIFLINSHKLIVNESN